MSTPSHPISAPVAQPAALPRDAWAQEPTLAELMRHDIWHLRRAFAERLLPDVAGWRVLEVGSGPAHDSLTYAQRGAHVTAFDCSIKGLNNARRIYDSLNLPLTTVCGKADALPFADNRFDLVFNAGVLEHFEDAALQDVIDEMIRVTKPGGILLVFCPNRYNIFYQTHLKRVATHAYDFERSFTADELRRRLNARGLAEVHLSGIHVHPAFNYLLPGWLPKHHRIEPWSRAAFAWLERMNALHRFKSLIGQDFVAWAVKPRQLAARTDLNRFTGGPAVRDTHAKAA